MNLHQRAVELVREYKRVEADLVDVLKKIDDQKLYKNFGASSLFVYATQVLGLTESVSWNFITVARATKTSPALNKAIQGGELSVSKARKITSVLTLQNESEWVEKAKTLSSRNLEKAVAKVNPKAVTPDRASYVTENFMKLEIGLSEKELEEIKYVQDLVCQSKQTAVSIKDAIMEMVRFYKQHKDPIEKAKRARPSKATLMTTSAQNSNKPVTGQVTVEQKTSNEPVTRQVTNDQMTSKEPVTGQVAVDQMISNENLLVLGATQRKPSSKPYSAALVHGLTQRDQNQCTGKNPDGSRCANKRWLDFHHIIPRFKGGKDTLENMTTLCRAHHQMQHETAKSSLSLNAQQP